MPPLTLTHARFRTIAYLGQLMYLERHGLIDERTRFFGCSLGAYFAVGYALSGREKRPGSLRERFVAAARASSIARRSATRRPDSRSMTRARPTWRDDRDRGRPASA